MGREEVQQYTLKYENKNNTLGISRTVMLRVNTGEQEVFQRDLFEQAVLTNAPSFDWFRCRVIDRNGRCVNTYYSPIKKGPEYEY